MDLVYNSEIKEDTSLTYKENEYSDITIEEVESSSQICSQIESENLSSQKSQVSSTFSTDEICRIGNDEFSLEYVQKVISFVDEHQNAKFKTIQKNFKRIKQPNYITRFRSHLFNFGSRNEKSDLIKKFVFDKFVMSRNAFLPVHDIDLRKWAIQKANEMHMENFVASHYWVHYFKFEYGIVSRKVTKLITKISEANIPIDSNKFISHAQK